jgi:imidazole glycerol-phosphate synthase subunit HisF
MLRKRIIVCLDVKDGRVVKGTRFKDLRDSGDPVELAQRYQADGADEIVFLDISATTEGRSTMLDLVTRTARRLFIPLTVGGGIGSVGDVGSVLRAGADKVAVNSAAVRRPELMTEASARFGSQCVVASIDAKDGRVFTQGGATATGMQAIEWAVTCVRMGAGEVLITSIDQDGSRSGYDCSLTSAVVAAVPVPVIASGGAGCAQHMLDVLTCGAHAALGAGMFHDGTTTVQAVKHVLAEAGVAVRA